MAKTSRLWSTLLGQLLLCVAGVPAALAGTNEWTQIGPAGSTVLALSVATDTGDLWAGTDMGGVFTSSDQGSTWSRVAGIDSRSCGRLEQSPSNASKWLAVAPGGVFLRQSGQWSRVLGMSDAEQFQDGCFGHDANTILAATTMGLYRSTDLGQTWTKITSGFGATELYCVRRNALHSGEVWVGGREGLFKSTDDGLTFTKKSTGLEGLAHSIMTSVAVSTWSADLMWVGTWYGVYESLDGGENWQRVTATPQESVRDFAVGPAGTGTPSTPAPVLALMPDGAYVRSASTGAWSQLRTGNFSAAHLGSSSWLTGSAKGVIEASTDAGGTWSTQGSPVGRPDVLQVVLDGQLGYGVFDHGGYDVHRVFKTTDGGATWTEVGAFPTRFEPLTVALDPTATVFVGSTEEGKRGILKSTDGGATWSQAAPASAVLGATLRVMHLAVSSNTPSFLVAGLMPGESSAFATHVYTATSPWSSWGGITPSAGGWPSVWVSSIAVRGSGEIWLGSLNGHQTPILLKSTNGGASWAQVGQGTILGAISDVTLDVQSGQTTAWFAVTGQGVLQTQDQGQTFTTRNVGLPDLNPNVIIKAKIAPTLFCASDAGALVRSTNAGVSWSSFAAPTPFARAAVIACSADGNTVLVGSVAEGLWHYQVSP